MLKQAFFLCFCFILLAIGSRVDFVAAEDPSQAGTESRTWTDASGRFSVEAKLVRQDAQSVRLQKKDGQVVSIKISQLSQADQDFLKQESENPFEPVQATTNAADAQNRSARIQGDRRLIPELDESFLIGDRSQETVVSTGGAASSWTFRPTGIQPKTDASSFRPIPLYLDSRFDATVVFNEERLFFADSSIAGVSFQIGLNDDAKYYLQLCRLDSGKTQILELPFPFLCRGISPDGTKIVGIRSYKPKSGGFPCKSILSVLTISGESPTPVFEFLPYFPKKEEKPGFSFPNANDIDDVCWANDELCLSSKAGTLVCWDVFQGKSIYSILGVGESLSFSADRQTFALASAGGVGLYETTTGRLLGVLPEKIERVGATAFSPDGRFLAVLGDGSLFVFDLSDGRTTRKIEASGSFNSKIFWADSGNVLVGGTLYHLEKELPVCNYGLFKPNAVQSYQGKIWTIVDEFKGKRQSFLVGVALPHPKAKETIENVDVANDFWFYPGSSVRLRFELNGFADLKETETILTKRLKQAKINVSSDANVEIFVQYRDTQKEEDVSYGQSDSPLRVPLPRLSRFGSRDLGSIKLKVFEQKIAFSVDSKEIWSNAQLTTGPRLIEYDPDKKIEDTIRETNKPDADFVKTAHFPRYIPKEGFGSNALTIARITSDGVQD